jgi:hypothetical protein
MIHLRKSALANKPHRKTLFMVAAFGVMLAAVGRDE